MHTRAYLWSEKKKEKKKKLGLQFLVLSPQLHLLMGWSWVEILNIDVTS